MKLRIKNTKYGAKLIAYDTFSQIASGLNRENAQTIAHRVNCFEELRDALAELFEREWQDDDGNPKLMAARKKASAALERAKHE